MGRKVYGHRWRLIQSLGGGGQGEIFRVADASGALQGEFALKRLRDASRLDCFRREIESLKVLSHPNIIKIVDHSALEDNTPPHFLVMPIADEGDPERRLPLFAGNTENVVAVSLQVASALEAAHRAQVVHRDVKPGNILFPGQGLDVWLSDFGICHVADATRQTPAGVIVGPRRFVAPEIEAGGAVDVAPSADVYSLGQLIFYLLSGGRTLYREDVHNPEYDQRHSP